MKKLIYLFLTVLIVACSGEDSNNGNNDNQSSCSGDNPIYLDDNGITIKACPSAQIGDTGNLNGFTYIIVSEQQLRDYVNDGYPDLNRLVTTQVTGMNSLFSNSYIEDGGISSWDVSNVTNMSQMFYYATYFNGDISSWDVSNLVDMSNMFSGVSSFNQDISSWDVSNVTDMNRLFQSSYFNEDLSSWDVSNVTNMYGMFREAPLYNQNLSSWSVDGVTSCDFFSDGASNWTLPQPNFTNCNPN
jgi:surface protein